MNDRDDIRYMSHEYRIAEGYMKAPETPKAEPRRQNPRAALRAKSIEDLDAIASDPGASASERGWARRIAASKRRA